jgi:hypothetical protein
MNKLFTIKFERSSSSSKNVLARISILSFFANLLKINFRKQNHHYQIICILILTNRTNFFQHSHSFSTHFASRIKQHKKDQWALDDVVTHSEILAIGTLKETKIQ